MSSIAHGLLNAFGSISVIDFEFQSLNGNRPNPVCLVVKDLRTGSLQRFWRDDLIRLNECPFPIGKTDLVLAFYASAEFGCMLELGWPLPQNIVDLHAEHRVETNGLYLPTGNSLLGALAYRGLARIDVAVKDSMRDLILGQSCWSPEEQVQILAYCTSDVEAATQLLSSMLPKMDLQRALLRGRYTKAVAHMERAGIPIDREVHATLVTNWDVIRRGLVKFIDQDFGLYDGMTFKRGRFSRWLRDHRIPWPRSEAGILKLDDETFKEQAAAWPILEPIRELRQTLGRMYLPSLQIGRDGRSRTLIGQFSSKTGRNQPSTKGFAFGLSRWQRGVIKPDEGYGLAYIDFSSQEICIAAGLSGDEKLIDAYCGGDPYLAFAKQAGLVPAEATRDSHSREREQCKTVVLGLNYGLGAEKMAYQAQISVALAKELIQRHRETYPVYWKWSADLVTSALLSGEISSIFGWRRQLRYIDKPTSLMNFPMQSNGAEMMRIAAIAMTEAGIEVCAPVHDAFLISAPLEVLDEQIAKARDLMVRAGRQVTGGVEIRTEAKVIKFPNRFMDPQGAEMWNLVVELARNPESQV
ncbi:MAG TPA: DNA polymerase [Bradyrhizobium sp.]|nr:DNA polymerase [Bradyrhizobium sp.]